MRAIFVAIVKFEPADLANLEVPEVGGKGDGVDNVNATCGSKPSGGWGDRESLLPTSLLLFPQDV